MEPSPPAVPAVVTDPAAWSSPGGTSDAPRFRSDPTRFEAPARPTRALPGSPVDRLQPRTVGQLLDGGFEVLRFRVRSIAIVSAVIVLPLYALPQLLVVFTTRLTDTTGFSPSGNPFLTSGGEISGGFWTTIGLGYLAGFGLMVATMLMGVAVTHLVTGWMVGQDPSPADTLRFVRSVLPRALGAFLLVALLKAIGAIPCGLGLVYLIPSLSILAPVVAAEGAGVIESIRRSFRLSRRRFGTVFGVVVLWWLASSLVGFATGLAAASVGGLATGSERGVATVVQSADVVATIVLAVVQVAVTVLLYIDLRVRTEGLDLDLEATERFGATAR